MSMCLGISIVQYKQLNVTEQFLHNLKWTKLLFRPLDNLGHFLSVLQHQLILLITSKIDFRTLNNKWS